VDAEDQDAGKPEAAEESSQHASTAANEKRARLRQALVQLVACLCSVGSMLITHMLVPALPASCIRTSMIAADK
jgi:hypothetical protein